MTSNQYPTANWLSLTDNEKAQFLEEREEAALIADEEQRKMHNKDSQDGIDDYLNWAGTKK